MVQWPLVAGPGTKLGSHPTVTQCHSLTNWALTGRTSKTRNTQPASTLTCRDGAWPAFFYPAPCPADFFFFSSSSFFFFSSDHVWPCPLLTPSQRRRCRGYRLPSAFSQARSHYRACRSRKSLHLPRHQVRLLSPLNPFRRCRRCRRRRFSSCSSSSSSLSLLQFFPIGIGRGLDC